MRADGLLFNSTGGAEGLFGRVEPGSAGGGGGGGVAGLLDAGTCARGLENILNRWAVMAAHRPCYNMAPLRATHSDGRGALYTFGLPEAAAGCQPESEGGAAVIRRDAGAGAADHVRGVRAGVRIIHHVGGRCMAHAAGAPGVGRGGGWHHGRPPGRRAGRPHMRRTRGYARQAPADSRPMPDTATPARSAADAGNNEGVTHVTTDAFLLYT